MIPILSILFLLFGVSSYSSDWPTHLSDNNRSAFTKESLQFPLYEAWRFNSQSPRRGWDDPAKQDFWHHATNLKPRMIFDRAPYVVSAGNYVYFGSTVDDQVYCLDADTGKIVWRFYTTAPVRLPPTLHDNKVFAGSDDGYVYCLDAESGEQIWKFHASPAHRLLPGNERIISPWAVRTGVLIDEGTAYFASGMFPEETVYLCAVNAHDGRVIWKHKIAFSPQGNLLASDTHLFLPTGRSTPAVFNKADGVFLKVLSGFGGSYAVLMGNQLAHGPGRTGQISVSSTESQVQIASFTGNHMIVTPNASYLHTDTELTAINRQLYTRHKREQAKLTSHQQSIERKLKKAKSDGRDELETALEAALRSAKKALGETQAELQKSILWNIPCAHPYSLILAGDHIYAGGENTVAAYDAAGGNEVWRADVRGKAYGLAVANGKLFVSTDQGVIHGFSMNRVQSINRGSRGKSTPFQYSIPSDNHEALQLNIQHEDFPNSSVPQKGYAVLTGWDQDTVSSLIAASKLHILVFEEEKDIVENARKWLSEQDLYGKRVVVFPETAQRSGLANYIANLVLIPKRYAKPVQKDRKPFLSNLVRPHGGMLAIHLMDQEGFSSHAKESKLKMDAILNEYIDWNGVRSIAVNQGENGTWLIAYRNPLPNTGEWTHLYANAGNTASSGDQTITQNTRLQWFGRPGPRWMIDRHLRPPSPLAKGGRLFIQANDKIIAADAYNGTVLWETGVPGFRRVGIPYDSGNMVVTDKYLYAVAGNDCWVLDVETGSKVKALNLPPSIQKKFPGHEWGFLAYSNGFIIGSAQHPNASRTEMSRDAILEQYGTFRPLVTSDALFLLREDSQEPVLLANKNSIINTTIGANSSDIFWIECNPKDAIEGQTGRIPLGHLLTGDVYLTGRHLTTGKESFKRNIDIGHLQHIVYLSCTEDIVTIVGSYDNLETRSVWYSVMAFDADTGEHLWHQRHENNRKGLGGDHGEQVHHPVILDDRIIAEPVAYELLSGEQITVDENPWYIPARSGCGTISASAGCLLFRDSNPVIMDMNSGNGHTPLTPVNRPGCWISMIPADGLVLMPEASSGCTCNYSIQTSMAFVPVD